MPEVIERYPDGDMFEELPAWGFYIRHVRGLRMTNFHSTPMCSPTRAALLTGRQHHSVHMGGIPEGANTFPGYDSVIPKSAAVSTFSPSDWAIALRSSPFFSRSAVSFTR